MADGKPYSKFLSLKNPTVAPYAGEKGLYIRVTGKYKSPAEAKTKVEEVSEEIIAELGDHYIGTDEENIQEAVGKLLLKHNRSVIFAESVTGGLMAAMLIDVPNKPSFEKKLYCLQRCG